jgi:hypothetical protein
LPQFRAELHGVSNLTACVRNGIGLASAPNQTPSLAGEFMWSWICCYVTGHDYAVGCDGGSMFLKCVVCGRRSQGWVVHGSHAHSHAPRA